MDRLIQTAFEDRVLNNMPESVCAGLCDRYLKERSALEEEISKAEKKRSEASADDFGFAEYVRKLKRYGGCEILTRELCLLLIEFITVGEKSGADGGRELHIFYRLAGE
ncbi:MAG: hypothetical protein K2H43_00390 [Clostridia bacterium]|nr:hypothetical protein [Clostridia bacterium]